MLVLDHQTIFLGWLYFIWKEFVQLSELADVAVSVLEVCAVFN